MPPCHPAPKKSWSRARTTVTTAALSALATAVVPSMASTPASASTALRTAAHPAAAGGRTIDGTLERIIVDPPAMGRARAAEPGQRPTRGHADDEEIVIVRGSHGRVLLDEAQARGLKTGQKVRVTVSPKNGKPLPTDTAEVSALVSSGDAQVSGVQALAPANTVDEKGPHRLLVVPVTWDSQTPTTTDPATIRSQLGSTDTYWNTVTNNRIDISDVVVDTPMTATKPANCNSYQPFFDIEDKARTQLGSKVQNQQRDHVVLLLPSMSSCWAGLGYVGGDASTPRTIWLNNDLSARVVAHELGHNLGLNHSGEYYCTDSDGIFTPLSHTCEQHSYDDPYDLMGGSYDRGIGSISATHMDQLGLLTAGGVVTSQNVLRKRYTLKPVTTSTTTDALRGLVIPAMGGELVVEYRTAAGQDSWIDSGDDTRPGVLIRGVGLGVDPYEDPDEEDVIRPAWAYRYSSWLPGQTMTAPDGTTTVSVVSADSSGAVVEVSQGTDYQAPNPFSISLSSPYQTNWVNPAVAIDTTAITDPDGSIARVDAVVDGTVWRQLTAAEIADQHAVIGRLPAGTHYLKLAAYDAAGNRTATNTLTVQVDAVAPLISSGPLLYMRGGPASTSSLPVTATWSQVTDAATGVKSTMMGDSPNDTPKTMSPTATSRAVRMPVGMSAAMPLRAYDNVNNMRLKSSPSTTPWVDTLSSTATGWSGRWTTYSSSVYFGGSEQLSGTSGASFTTTRTGRSFGLVATKNPTRGQVAVYVDGAYVSTVDLYSASATYSTIVWTKSFSSNSSHTITVVNLGTSGRGTVGIDGLVALS